MDSPGRGRAFLALSLQIVSQFLTHIRLTPLFKRRKEADKLEGKKVETNAKKHDMILPLHGMGQEQWF